MGVRRSRRRPLHEESENCHLACCERTYLCQPADFVWYTCAEQVSHSICLVEADLWSFNSNTNFYRILALMMLFNLVPPTFGDCLLGLFRVIWVKRNSSALSSCGRFSSRELPRPLTRTFRTARQRLRVYIDWFCRLCWDDWRARWD